MPLPPPKELEPGEPAFKHLLKLREPGTLKGTCSKTGLSREPKYQTFLKRVQKRREKTKKVRVLLKGARNKGRGDASVLS